LSETDELKCRELKYFVQILHLGIAKKRDELRIGVHKFTHRSTVSLTFNFCHFQFSGIAINITEPLYPSPSLNGYSSHYVFLQNLPSALTSHILAPRPGEIVLDMCAAPGIVPFQDKLVSDEVVSMTSQVCETF
jgi:hypothetical protein